MVIDWMDALQDYPLDEVREACRAAVRDNPNKMPNEGHVVAQIMAARAKAVAARKRAAPPMEEPRPQPTPEERARVSEYAATLLRGFGQTNKGEA
jgi:acyl-CoA reductase-like NAD-dependent aldehyde dehydrogenase